MKRIIYLSLCACLLTSCSLDLQPENGLTYSNSFNTEKELNATTTSIQYYINTTVGNNYDFATAGGKNALAIEDAIRSSVEYARQALEK